MSASDLEQMFRMALSLGMPPNEVERLRRDPQQLLSLLAAQQRPAATAAPSIASQDATPDELAQVYKAHLDSTKAHILAEQKRPQRFPPAADRLSTIANTEHTRTNMAKMDATQEHQILWNFMGFGKHSSSTPLEQLKPIRFKEMKVTKMHEGRFLLCRIVSSPLKMVGLSFVVEDQDGRSPTDSEILSPKHPLVKGAKWATSSPAAPRPASFDFKALGNRYFAAKKDLLAVKAYSDGLDSTDDAAKRLVLFLNRAQAHLRLGNFASALRDTAAVLAFLASDVTAPPLAEVKATLRRAKAFEGLRQLKSAREAYGRVLELDPTSADALSSVQRVERMLHESATGEYDWRQIVKDEDAGVKHERSVGDFVGRITVAEIEGRGGGRGVVATRDIKAGELLLVEKAFATGEATKSRMVMGFNFATDSASDPSKMALVTACAAKIQDDPASAALLYTLHGGRSFKAIGDPVLGAQQDRDLGSSAQPACADIARIEGICLVNAFGLKGSTPTDLDSDLPDDGGSALFLGSSLFNHSCAPNASWKVYGDVQVVRARAPVKAGAEIYIAYVPAEAPQKRRDGVLKAHFPGGCQCAYCVDERRDTAQQVARRAELVGPSSRYVALRDESRSKTAPLAPVRVRQLAREIKGVVEQLEGTYSRRRGDDGGSSSYRPDLVEPYHVSAHIAGHPTLADFVRLGNAYELQAIAASGAVVVVDTPGGERIEVVAAPCVVQKERTPAERSLLKIAYRHAHVGAEADARRWIVAAGDMARVTHGLEWDGFVERAGNDLDMFGLRRLVEGCRA
ncbi:hypothetical protein JCM9279_005655 [Rhodotorula babjevae]